MGWSGEFEMRLNWPESKVYHVTFYYSGDWKSLEVPRTVRRVEDIEVEAATRRGQGSEEDDRRSWEVVS